MAAMATVCGYLFWLLWLRIPIGEELVIDCRVVEISRAIKEISLRESQTSEPDAVSEEVTKAPNATFVPSLL